MSVQISVIKIHLREGDDVFLLSEYETDKKLILKILNAKRNDAYIGEANDKELRSQAAFVRQTFNDFIRRIKQALFRGTSDDGSKFLYSLDNEDENCIFKWKLTDEEEAISILLGSLNMKKTEFAVVITDVLQSVSVEMRKLNSLVQDFEVELKRSQNQLSDALKQLSAANDIKAVVEKELYSKFILVLNEKKRKIRELERNSKSNSSLVSNIKTKKKKKIERMSESDDYSDEMEADVHQPGPSKMTSRDSLSFFDENHATKTIASKSKIRNRKPAAAKNLNVTDDSINSKHIKCTNNNDKFAVDDDDESIDSLLDFL